MQEEDNIIDINEIGIYDTYINLHNKYTEKYGKACVLFQSGSFLEIYGKEDENQKLGDIYTLAAAAGDLVVAKKTNGWLMCGFGLNYSEKYFSFLIENNYTIILVEQISPPPKPKRKITKIISPSTYIDDVNLGCNLNKNAKSKNKVLMSVFIEFRKSEDILAISMAAMDLSIAKSTIYNICSTIKNNDKEICVDECFRFIHSMSPIEIIFYTEKDEHIPLLKERIKDFNIENFTYITHVNIIPKEFFKTQYLQSFLGKFYDNIGILSPIEYLELEKNQSLTTTFALLINFAYEHDENITKKLHKPLFWEQSKYATIENNGIYQLNIVKTHNINQSLIDILDYTSTNVGKRLHKERLLNPIMDSSMLSNRYNQIEWMINDNKYKEFENKLSKVLDIERLHRKIENGTINPQHFILLERSYEHILKVMDLFEKHIAFSKDDSHCVFNFWGAYMHEKFLMWYDDYHKIFNLEECQKYRIDNIKGSFFNRGIDKKIDELQDKITRKTKEIYDFATILSDSIRDHVVIVKKRGKKNDSIESDNENEKDLVKVERNDRDGYFFTTSNKRADLIKKYHLLDDENDEDDEDKSPYNDSTLKYSKQSTTTKITCDVLNSTSTLIEKLEEDLQNRCRELFLSKIQELYGKHKNIFGEIVQFISEIDWICSCAKCAVLNFYCKPEIEKNDNVDSSLQSSFIKAKSMRHPIIEKILDKSHYIPNDIDLGTKEQCGILLFGTNSSGKSCLMKQIGVNVIMAQAGMYVACKSFIYYPYKNILTRISGEDNFSKGFSSFVVEMIELRTILNRSSHNSLILVDELTRGTEQNSALSIATSSIIELSKKNCNFIFTTHLHSLSSLDEITELKNIKSFHLKVNFDEENSCLIYDRVLEEGSGSNLYGLEVAKFVINDNPKFIEQCMKIRRKILNIPQEILSPKISKYNAKLIVDLCEICNKNAVDVHHIDFQCTADDDGLIQKDNVKFDKNKMANLVPLCKMCHIKTHHIVDGKKFIIQGYIKTSKGLILKWEEKNI